MKETNKADCIIDKLLIKYDADYPQARLEALRTETEKEWHHSRDRLTMPYIIIENGRRDFPETPSDTSFEQQLLIEQLLLIRNHAQWNDSFYPGIGSGIAQSTIPSAFGCAEEFANGNMNVVPCIQQVQDVYCLPEPDFTAKTTAGKMLSNMRYCYKRTQGKIPVYITDMQGPFSIAAQMWGIEDFILALYDEPEAAHHLLKRCTDAIIQYFHAMDRAVEENLIPIHCHPVLWMPKDQGVAVSDDFAAIISPDIFREFSMPYLEQIGKEFGGLTLHSCGSLNHMVQALNEMDTLRALNFSATETDFPRLASEIKEEILLIVHNSAVAMPGLRLLTPAEHISLCCQVLQQTQKSGICIAFDWEKTADPAQQAQAFAALAHYKRE